MTSSSESRESVTETGPGAEDVFFCHICNDRVDHINQDYTCPRCNGGFLERVEANETSTEQQQPILTSQPNNTGNMYQMLEQFFGGLVNSGQTPGGSQSATGMNQPSAQGQNDVLNMFLQQLVQNLNAEGATHIQFHINADPNNPGGAHTVIFPENIHGNPGDYAWGPGGLDQIVTQLLNQFEGGAPPLRKTDIKKIPIVQVSAEQVARKMQCTTCMEDFVIAESVRQLYCGHCFHESCIIPWLERHNTCPICRKIVGKSGDEASAGSASSEAADTRPTPVDTNVMDAIDELD